MLLQNTHIFAQLSNCWWKNIVLRGKNTNTLTSVCGLGLEDVMLSDGPLSHHILEQKQHLQSQELLKGHFFGQSCRSQAGDICLLLAQGEH